MTLLHLHHDEGVAHTDPLGVGRFFRRIGAAFRILHRSIVNAKLGRVQREWMFRPDYSDMQPGEQDVTNFPQRPLVLGDKWDF
jgi:hypothetical protein